MSQDEVKCGHHLSCTECFEDWHNLEVERDVATARDAQRDEEIARLQEEVEAWQDASGLCMPAEENGGDPGGVTPDGLRKYMDTSETLLDAAQARVAKLEAALRKIADARHEFSKWEVAGKLADIAHAALEAK